MPPLSQVFNFHVVQVFTSTGGLNPGAVLPNRACTVIMLVNVPRRVVVVHALKDIPGRLLRRRGVLGDNISGLLASWGDTKKAEKR